MQPYITQPNLCSLNFALKILVLLSCFSENSTTSLSSLVDMSHQTRIVALLIVNPQVFDDVPDEPEATQGNGSNEENDSSLPNTPVEVILDYNKLILLLVWCFGLKFIILKS